VEPKLWMFSPVSEFELKNAPVLDFFFKSDRCRIAVLDEATAAIDKATDETIQRALLCEMGTGTTVLTVAHRLETIISSDNILVMDQGRVAEFGTPAALLDDRTTHFAALWFGRENAD